MKGTTVKACLKTRRLRLRLRVRLSQLSGVVIGDIARARFLAPIISRFTRQFFSSTFRSRFSPSGLSPLAPHLRSTHRKLLLGHNTRHRAYACFSDFVHFSGTSFALAKGAILISSCPTAGGVSSLGRFSHRLSASIDLVTPSNLFPW